MHTKSYSNSWKDLIVPLGTIHKNPLAPLSLYNAWPSRRHFFSFFFSFIFFILLVVYFTHILGKSFTSSPEKGRQESLHYCSHSLTDPVIHFVLWCHACLTLTSSPLCLLAGFSGCTNGSWGSNWGNMSNRIQAEKKLPHLLLFFSDDSLAGVRGGTAAWQSEGKGRLRIQVHCCVKMKNSLGSEWSYFVSWRISLPLHMFTSGHSLSSSSGPVHWVSFSCPEMGRPESRSRQAR